MLVSEARAFAGVGWEASIGDTRSFVGTGRFRR
jgi:hypothetical protein